MKHTKNILRVISLIILLATLAVSAAASDTFYKDVSTRTCPPTTGLITKSKASLKPVSCRARMKTFISTRTDM